MPEPSRTGLVLAPDDAASAAARAVVRFHLRTFERQAVGARAGQVEPVHQLRVATRRLRAALRLFAPVLPAAPAAAAGADLSWLGRAIGAVRDLDVLALAVAARSRGLDPETRAAVGTLERTIREQRAAAHAALVEALASPRGVGLIERLTVLAQGPATERRGTRLGLLAPDLIRPLARAVLHAGHALGPESPPEALHRLRVRVKRLRYALETLRGLGGGATSRVLAQLENLQDLLGEHQDAVTQIAWLRRHAESESEPPATLLAMGALVHRLGRRARRQRRRFVRAWKRLDRGRLRRLLRERRSTSRGRLHVVGGPP